MAADVADVIEQMPHREVDCGELRIGHFGVLRTLQDYPTMREMLHSSAGISAV